MNVYFDSSALLKLYLEEHRSEETRQLANASSVLVCSLVGLAECVASIRRAMNTGRIRELEAAAARVQFEQRWKTVAHVDLDDELLARAADLAWKHGLKGFDAIHLASALLARDGLAEPLTFATFDAALSRAAHDEGFEAWP